MKNKFTSIAILLPILYLGSIESHFQKKNTTNYEQLAMMVEREAIEEIESKYNLKFCGSGGGMMDCIRLMSLCFDCSHNVSLEEASSLVSNCYYLFLDLANNSDSIRPYLCKYPLDSENIKIIIYFSQPNGEGPLNFPYSSACTINGSIRFLGQELNERKTVPITPREDLH